MLGGLERKVVVLRTGHLVARKLHAAQHVSAHHEHVHHVVIRVQQVTVEVRLEARRVAGVIVFLEVVLIAIEQVGIGVLGRESHIALEHVGRERVVVVGKSHVVARGGANAYVGIAGDAKVLGEVNGLDARVRIGGQYFLHALVVRARVYQHELPGGIGLREHRVDHVAQVGQRRVVQRADDAHERVEVLGDGALRQGLGLGVARVRAVDAGIHHVEVAADTHALAAATRHGIE